MALGLRKNDVVKIVSGENKGLSGRIIKVFPKKKRAIVEGQNMIKRHTKPSPKNQQGGILEKEASVHISNLMLVCPKTSQATRLGVRILDNKRRVRYSKKAKELVD